MPDVDSVADIEIRKERSPLAGPILPVFILFLFAYFATKDVTKSLGIAFMAHILWLLF